MRSRSGRAGSLRAITRSNWYRGQLHAGIPDRAPALLTAGGESRVRINGGTHNRGSPPFDFLARSFLPLLGRMGAEVQLDLTRHGFYPRGGGEIRARIAPAPQLGALNLKDRGAWVRGYAEAYVAAIPMHVAQRELEVIARKLGGRGISCICAGCRTTSGRATR